jgi:hypothetical protein
MKNFAAKKCKHRTDTAPNEHSRVLLIMAHFRR